MKIFKLKLTENKSSSCDEYLNECEKPLNGIEFSELNTYKETLDEKI